MKKGTIAMLIFTLAVIGGLGYLIHVQNNKPGQYDKLAQCIKDSGAKFYGAFWCPHCQNEKKMFGKSAKLLPYVECSTPDGSGQNKICTDLGIKGYPTWTFPDGTTETGEIKPEDLATKTSCPLK